MCAWILNVVSLPRNSTFWVLKWWPQLPRKQNWCRCTNGKALFSESQIDSCTWNRASQGEPGCRSGSPEKYSFQKDTMGLVGQEEISTHGGLMETCFHSLPSHDTSNSLQETSMIRVSLPPFAYRYKQKRVPHVHPETPNFITHQPQVLRASHPNIVIMSSLKSKEPEKLKSSELCYFGIRKKPTETRHIFKREAVPRTLQG